MPYKSDAQRKFFHTDTAKKEGITSDVVNEFDKASKGKELPEHIKKMAEGGKVEEKTWLEKLADSMSTRPLGSDKSDAEAALHVDDPQEPPKVSTDTEKHYAEGGKVERSSLEHPEPNAMMARAMSEGGYPHVTFLENVSTPEMKKTVHLEDPSGAHGAKITKGHEENYAEGGTVHKAEGRDKEPSKPADIDMSHEKKLNSIYKAMGIKKFQDGGVATTDALPTPGSAPNPNDPTFWDQIKAALAQTAAPITKPMNAVADITKGAVDAAVPMVKAAAPGAVSAINTLTGANLPMPPTPAPEAPAAAAPVAPPAAPPIVPTPAPKAPVTPPSTAGAGMPDLKSIYNQDTSKLTEGVNAEDRQKLAGDLQTRQSGIGDIIAKAVSGLGDALAAKGGKDQHSLQGIFGLEKTQRDEALANFDKARQARLEKLTLQTQMGDNALKQAAAADAYGVDDHLNSMIGAPKGTMKKDLPTYFSLMSANVAAQEKDAELYMKAHAQGAADVENAQKNASVLGIKPSAAQLQASGAKLADQYYNRAKGNLLVKPSDGSQAQWIPAKNLAKAKQMDPNLQIQP